MTDDVNEPFVIEGHLRYASEYDSGGLWLGHAYLDRLIHEIVPHMSLPGLKWHDDTLRADYGRVRITIERLP
jgi:hypothetical protein